MKYNAFLSYSHAQDSDLAPHIETALEKFAKPLFKQRALHIFRDANDLSASPDLWGKIEEGLKNSEYFIFLASPKAAQSRWCKKEVDCWKENHSMSNFLVVMTDGDIAWDETKSDFDWDKTTAIPDNLSGAFVNEPLYVDFRNHNNKELGLEYPDFKTKTVLLAATIHGKSVGDMIGENVQQHKRMLRIRNSTIAILTMLLIAVGTAGFYANEQRKEAIHNANRALAKSYLSDSKANISQDPTLAVKLAAMAYKFAKSDSMNLQTYEDQLITSFNGASHFYISHDNFELQKDSSLTFPIQKEFNQMRISYDGNHQLILEDSLTKKTIDRNLPPAEMLSFSSNGKFIVEQINNVPSGNRDVFNYIHVYGLNGKLIADVSTHEPNAPPLIRFNKDGNRFLLSGYGTEETVMVSYNEDEYEEYKTIVLTTKLNITAFEISQDGNMAAIGYSNGEIEVFQLKDFSFEIKPSWILKGHSSEAVNIIAFDSNDQFLLSQSNSFKRKWILNTHLPYIQMNEHPNNYNISLGQGGTRFDEGYIMFTGQNDAIEFYRWIDEEVEEVYARFDIVKGSWEKNTSPNGRFYATNSGLFNSKAERLIPFDFPVTSSLNIEATAFSNDLKYLFADKNIYLLDPELILKRFNDTAKFGVIDPFTIEEREQYLIPKDY